MFLFVQSASPYYTGLQICTAQKGCAVSSTSCSSTACLTDKVFEPPPITTYRTPSIDLLAAIQHSYHNMHPSLPVRARGPSFPTPSLARQLRFLPFFVLIQYHCHRPTPPRPHRWQLSCVELGGGKPLSGTAIPLIKNSNFSDAILILRSFVLR